MKHKRENRMMIKALPLAISMLSGSALAASITLVPNSTNVTVGDTVTVDVVMDFTDVYSAAGGGTVGGGIDVTFDNAVLGYGSYTPNSVGDAGFQRSPDLSGNKLIGIAAGGLGESDGTNTSPALGATDTIGTLTFTATTTGTAALSAADNVSPAGGFYSFDGQPIPVTYNGTSITVGAAVAACEGDLNNNGVVDFADYLLLAGDWGRSDCAAAACAGDINNNGVVDFADYLLLAADWGRSDCP